MLRTMVKNELQFVSFTKLKQINDTNIPSTVPHYGKINHGILIVIKRIIKK